MKNKILVAFLVTWKITGYNLQQCQDPKGMDPISRTCTSEIAYTMSQSFEKKEDAKAWEKTLREAKRPYSVSDVHMYEESK